MGEFSATASKQADIAVIVGTLNDQTEMLNNLKELNIEHILCVFNMGKDNIIDG